MLCLFTCATDDKFYFEGKGSYSYPVPKPSVYDVSQHASGLLSAAARGSVCHCTDSLPGFQRKTMRLKGREGKRWSLLQEERSRQYFNFFLTWLLMFSEQRGRVRGRQVRVWSSCHRVSLLTFVFTFNNQKHQHKHLICHLSTLTYDPDPRVVSLNQ